MKNKQLTQLVSVGAANNKLQSLRKIQLPWLLRRDQARPEQVGVFTSEDVQKIIQHIITKGQRYSMLKKGITNQQALRLQEKLKKSSFVHVMIRRALNNMGDERRLGTGLRGFSKLLLQELQKECWSLILSEMQLLRNQMLQKQQKQKIAEIQCAIHSQILKADLL